MASTDAHPFPMRARALRVTAPVLDATGQLVTTGTTVVTISKDAGTFANPNAGATNATQIATTSGVWYADLNATDLTCDTLAIKFTNGSNPATVLVIYPVSIPEPASVPAFGSGGVSLEELLGWLLAMSRNKRTQTNTTTTLRNDADSANLATSAVSDNGAGTTTFAEWT